MQTVSKWGMFKTMFLKELHEIKTEMLIVTAIAVLAIGLTYIKTDGEARGLLLLLPIMLALGLAAFLPLATSFKLIRDEWKHNTVYLMMSLPVPGTMTLGAKLLTLMVQFLAGTILVGGIGALAVYTSFPDEITRIWQDYGEYMYYGVLVYLSSLTSILFICCTSFFSQMTGRLVKKGQGLLTFVVFIAIIIVVNNIVPEFSGIIIDDPILPELGPEIVKYIYLGMGLNVLIAAVLFIGSVFIWERRVEL